MRISELAIILALCTVAIVAAVALTAKPRTAPHIDEPSQPVVTNIEAIGPAALCDDISQLRSERGPDGVTVHWCERA